MANKIIYPLQEVLQIKHNRVADAEKVVAIKKEALAKEEEILKQRKEERDKVKQHHTDKLNQMREEMDGGTTSPKIQQMKAYIEVVIEKVHIEQQKVKEQKQQVKAAEQEVKAAEEELKKRRDEVEKIETHKVDWIKEARMELDIEEQREMDDLGSQMFLTNRLKHK